MRMLHLAVKLESDALTGDGRREELARLLRTAAERVEQGKTQGQLLDINGNTVGSFAVMHSEPL